MNRQRATKTSTLRALRSVNDAMRSAVRYVEATATGHTEANEDGYAVRWVEDRYTVEQLAERCESALAQLRNAEDRLVHARNHLLSYQNRLLARAEVEARSE
jgi:hypothetical protein